MTHNDARISLVKIPFVQLFLSQEVLCSGCVTCAVQGVNQLMSSSPERYFIVGC